MKSTQTLNLKLFGSFLVLLVFVAPAIAERTKLKPGWPNIFSPAQDVEMGKLTAAEAEKQLVLLNDQRVDQYLGDLGRRLAAKAPGDKYPYQFKAVNDRSLNAFALPGGFLFVHRGIIEAADNEAQLAGVIGHEIGHVVLRHGTNQVSKAYIAQAPLAILSGVLGEGSVLGVLAKVGGGFGTESLLLKFSRDAERQSDIIGTQILYDSKLDPRAMAQFFEKFAAESKSGRPPQWLSSHPDPENRIVGVKKEIENLGGLPEQYSTGSQEFFRIKSYVKSLPPPPPTKAKPSQPAPGGQPGQKPGGQTSPGTSAGRPQRPAPPSQRYKSYQGALALLRYPDNWKTYIQGNSVTICPEGGLVDDGHGGTSVAYGLILDLLQIPREQVATTSLAEAHNRLLEQLRSGNAGMRISRSAESIRLDGETAWSSLLRNDSPMGGLEKNLIISVMRPEGLLYVVFVAPEADYKEYEPSFQAIQDSVRLSR
jgi:beta-barrel assembly-enhancing protease